MQNKLFPKLPNCNVHIQTQNGTYSCHSILYLAQCKYLFEITKNEFQDATTTVQNWQQLELYLLEQKLLDYSIADLSCLYAMAQTYRVRPLLCEIHQIILRDGGNNGLLLEWLRATQKYESCAFAHKALCRHVKLLQKNAMLTLDETDCEIVQASDAEPGSLVLPTIIVNPLRSWPLALRYIFKHERNAQTCDVAFQIGASLVYAHRCVVAQHSIMLNGMLYGTFEHGSDAIVPLAFDFCNFDVSEQLSLQVFTLLLEHMYTSAIEEIFYNQCFPLIVSLHYFGIDNCTAALEQCQHIILANEELAPDLLAFAKEYDLKLILNKYL